MTAADNPSDVHFSREEVEMAVEEAKRRRVPVMAHAHSSEAIRLAVDAGVDTIEHGTFADEATLREMATRGVYLVPTIQIGDVMLEMDEDGPLAKAIALTRKTRPTYMDVFRKAHQRGVKIAVGTDLGGWGDDHLNAREFQRLKEIGMTPIEAIRAGTSVAAEMLGWEDTGTIEAGKAADLIAVPGNPLTDLTVLERVEFVMRAGRIARGPGCHAILSAPNFGNLLN